MQPAAFTPTQKAASERLHPPHVALFGPSVVTQVQRHDPRDSGARGVARPKPGPGRGAGPDSGDVTPSRMAAAVLKRHQSCLPECNQQPARPLRKAASVRMDTPCMALFGSSVVTQVQRPDPQASGARGVARPKPGPGRGVGPAQGDLTPSRMAAAVLKPAQGCLPECNQQSLSPLGRLLRGGWTPYTWHFSGLAW